MPPADGESRFRIRREMDLIAAGGKEATSTNRREVRFGSAVKEDLWRRDRLKLEVDRNRVALAGANGVAWAEGKPLLVIFFDDLLDERSRDGHSYGVSFEQQLVYTRPTMLVQK